MPLFVKYTIDCSTSCPMRSNENTIYFTGVVTYRSTCLFQKQLQPQFSAPRVHTQQIWNKFCRTGVFYSWHLILKNTVDLSATKHTIFSANLRKVSELWPFKQTKTSFVSTLIVKYLHVCLRNKQLQVKEKVQRSWCF